MASLPRTLFPNSSGLYRPCVLHAQINAVAATSTTLLTLLARRDTITGEGVDVTSLRRAVDATRDAVSQCSPGLLSATGPTSGLVSDGEAYLRTLQHADAELATAVGLMQPEVLAAAIRQGEQVRFVGKAQYQPPPPHLTHPQNHTSRRRQSPSPSFPSGRVTDC
jgi:hypothetical protein